MNGTLRVTPEQLLATSSDFANQGNEIAAIGNEMMDFATNLNSIWQGEAADAFITKMKNLQDDIDTMNRMIQEHVKDLEEIARAYSDAEKAAQESAQALNDQVVGG